MPLGEPNHDCTCKKISKRMSNQGGFCNTCHAYCQKHPTLFHRKKEGCILCPREQERKESEEQKKKDEDRDDKEKEQQSKQDAADGVEGGRQGKLRGQKGCRTWS